MKRMLLVGVGTVAAALLLGQFLSREPAVEAGDAGGTELAAFALDVELTADGMEPYRVRIPKDHKVTLRVHAGPEAPEGMLSVSGYEDACPAQGIGPGLSRELVFESRRPGDDFAFTLGGDVVGRLEVTGSHLEEGHQ